jgi:hypothetical protein
MKLKLTALFSLLGLVLLFPVSCSRTGGIPPPPPPDPCLTITINLTGLVTNPSATGVSDGSITVNATGGTGFTFCINGGAYQSSNKFKNLAAGNYTVIAKNTAGCTNSISFVLSDPASLCTGVNIVVSPGAGSNIPCEAATASITVSAWGGAWPYMYSLNGGSFQSSNVFDSITTGSYIVAARDANGCTGTASTTVNNGAAGPLFMQVRAIIQNNCLYCHGGAISSGGVNYSEDCNIVANKTVDGNPSPMPQSGLLPVSERQKIINWINAGGRYTD